MMWCRGIYKQVHGKDLAWCMLGQCLGVACIPVVQNDYSMFGHSGPKGQAWSLYLAIKHVHIKVQSSAYT